MGIITATGFPLTTPIGKWALHVWPVTPPLKVVGVRPLLNSSGVIKGRAVNATGPLPYCRVVLFIEGEETQVTCVMTDTNGYYRFDRLYIGLPILYYTVIIYPPLQNARIYRHVQAVTE